MTAVAKQLNGTLEGGDLNFSNVSIDTRTLQSGDAYLALRGERFDGHDFVEAAEAAGAQALIVEEKLTSSLPQLIVNDGYEALGTLARLNRQQSSAIVIALTGSQGKTTVKEMLNSILSIEGETLATSANLNNTIGVPLTLLRLSEEHEYAVIEMGANKAGEIAFSSSVTSPDIALITLASAAHVEGFGSLDGIAQAKGEILDSLKSDGVAVLNADDKYLSNWSERASRCRRVTFSASGKSDAEYFATSVELKKNGQVVFQLSTPQGATGVELNLLGKHNVTNATAAAAVAMEAGASLQSVREGLRKLLPVKGRLVTYAGIGGSVLIDDTYNASPDAFFAAIDVLSQFDGRKVLIAGDMKELGEESDAAHRAVGAYAKEQAINSLLVTGTSAHLYADSYGDNAVVFASQDELLAYSRLNLNSSDVVLVKGSRGAQMDIVVDGLKIQGSE